MKGCSESGSAHNPAACADGTFIFKDRPGHKKISHLKFFRSFSDLLIVFVRRGDLANSIEPPEGGMLWDGNRESIVSHVSHKIPRSELLQFLENLSKPASIH